MKKSWMLLVGVLAAAPFATACGTDGDDEDGGSGGSVAPVEICDNGVDDDGDFKADCADRDCKDVCGDEVCDNGADDDGDGKTDCDDVECRDFCVDEICDDDIENDDDGLIDCDDPECAEHHNCIAEICDNEIDDDGDGFEDCDDDECENQQVCIPEICDNDVDDDGDELVDCDDEECATTWHECIPEVCDNGVDDDGDGFEDCDDDECVAEEVCVDEICDDGEDNDDDDLIDCDDGECATHHACIPEICGDDVENDGDGFLDCVDDECWIDPLCQFTPGDLVISEIAFNLSGNSTGAQWFEVYNPGKADVDMLGWQVFDPSDGGFTVTIDQHVVVPAGGFATLAQAPAAADRIGFEATGSYDDSVVFSSGGDLLDLRDPAGTTVDVVDFGFIPAWFRGEAGRTFSLDGSTLDAASNDSFAAWCFTPNDGTHAYVRTDASLEQRTEHGTPGAAIACPPKVEVCDDFVDNDFDGDMDCGDTACAADPACLVEHCSDGADNDNDGDVDCADADCGTDPYCIPEIDCANGMDDDSDGDTDCADAGCMPLPECQP